MKDRLGDLLVAWCWAGPMGMPLLNSLNRLPPACRLALYVYEYLLHVGAQKSAQTFLSEVSEHLSPPPGRPRLS